MVNIVNNNEETYQVKDYYNVVDIMNVTGKKKSLAYKLIRILQDKFQKEFPDAIVIQGLIPKWYFEKIMKNKRE